ncbi:hypothetical protein BGX23_002275 [Mortierella sp. AD031]|nr:hypothetical protein BGX23_002275 [Mortierella sp. AD031]
MSRCHDALLLPEILHRVLQFVPLWGPCDPTDYEYNDIALYPKDILNCSLVCKDWREPALNLLFYVHTSKYQKKLPESLVTAESARYRIFVDSSDFWTYQFENLQKLVVLDVQSGINFGQMYEVLERSPRLEHLRWMQLDCIRRGNCIPEEHMELILKLTHLRVLILDNWEVDWADLITMVRSNPNLRTLGLGSMSRCHEKPFPYGPKEIETMVLPVEDLRLQLLWSPDDSTIDLIEFMPHLKRLWIDILCVFDLQLFIAKMKKARARLSLLTNAPTLPASKLECLEIRVQGTFEPTEQEINYLTSQQIIALMDCAQPEGLTRLELDVATVCPLLCEAIRTPPDPIPWLRSILVSCQRLRIVHLDLIGLEGESKVPMGMAQELFCGVDENGVVAPDRAWGCAGTLEDLTVLGMRKPMVVDFAGYLGWKYRKSRRKTKFWKGNGRRLNNLLAKGGNDRDNNKTNADSEESSFSEEERPRDDDSMSMTQEMDFFDRLMQLATKDPDENRPYQPRRTEKQFNAQLAAQFAQCPKLTRVRLNHSQCTQEIEDLRARQRVLLREQEILREHILAAEKRRDEALLKQSQKQQQKQQKRGTIW